MYGYAFKITFIILFYIKFSFLLSFVILLYIVVLYNNFLLGESKINKRYKNNFDDLKNNCENFYNKSFKKIIKWPIFLFISPGKLCVLCCFFITLLVCGVGFYGLFVIILLLLLFIFIP